MANYARSVNTVLSTCNFLKPWVTIPTSFPEDATAAAATSAVAADPWAMWNVIRAICDSHANLGICTRAFPVAVSVIRLYSFCYTASCCGD